MILIGTAETSLDTQSTGMEHGADGYILRHIPVREFVARIDALANLQFLEEKASYLNRVLYAIRNVNQLIIHEKDRQRLLQKTCELLIETGGYFNAWMVTFTPDGRVESVVEAGIEEKFAEMHQRLMKGELTAVEKQAKEQKEVVLVEDPHSFCTDYPLARHYQGQGAMSVSLRYGNQVYGVLTVSLPKEFLYEAEEQSLLHEVACDLAFALHNLELEESKAKIRATLQESEEKYRLLAETTQDIILILDLQGVIQTLTKPGWILPVCGQRKRSDAK